jgi:hypothetical protein
MMISDTGFVSLERLSTAYSVPLNDVYLMSLNLFGISTNIGDGRARMELRLNLDPETEWHVIIPTGMPSSPFSLQNETLFLDGERISSVRLIEHDDARLGYLRAAGQVMTLNTNRRSTCTGCVFCPNTLADANDPRIAQAEDEVEEWLRAFLIEHGWQDFAGLKEINLSTGCFGEETSAINHLTDLRVLLSRYGFQGRLGLLSSVIRTAEGMRSLAAAQPFVLFLTLECLGRRTLLLKKSKAELQPDEAIRVLERARDAGLDTGVMIVVGLDELPVVLDWLGRAAPYLTDFPNLQIFQSHSRLMDLFRAPGADTLEFFLKARVELERLFLPTTLRPRRWQNYRPLWHYVFGTEPLPLWP